MEFELLSLAVPGLVAEYRASRQDNSTTEPSEEEVNEALRWFVKRAIADHEQKPPLRR